MRPTLTPRPINGPLQDPSLYVAWRHQPRAVLFDCGNITPLAPREILKLSDIFITHTHMDHFAGFDHVLRLVLGREKKLRMVGPAGFLRNLENKLGAYTWNLVGNYATGLEIFAMEIHDDHCRTQHYRCQTGFHPTGTARKAPFSGVIRKEPALAFRAQILDHQTPCLGFAMKERFHVNIQKSGLEALEISPGPWLQTFKKALFQQLSAESPFTIPASATNTGEPLTLTLGHLTPQIARITQGQKIAYIVDAAWTPENVKRMLLLSSQADHLFIEAAFTHEDRAIARSKAHLTARQAGLIAGRAGVRRFSLLHFSPRYEGRETVLMAEAQHAYSQSFQSSSTKGMDPSTA